MILRLSALLALLSWSAAAALGQTLWAPPAVAQGEGFTVAVHIPDPEVAGAAPPLVRFNLETEGGRIVVSGPAVRDGPVYVGALGVPTTQSPGRYRISAVWVEAETTRTLESDFEVLDTIFALEEIALDQAMTDLRTSEDPRKIEEALELQGILAAFNPGSRFHESKFALPVAVELRTAEFGDRRTFRYADGGTAGSIHTGVDYRAQPGAPVRASGAGRVVLAKPRIITGKTVVLEHQPGMYTLYYHLSSIAVKVGELVTAGSLLGVVGATGLVTGPHLHWELRIHGVPVNPESYLARPLLDKGLIPDIINGTDNKGR